MIRVDANVILRYLLGDHPEHSEQAAEIIDRFSVFVSGEVLCEVVYVLSGVYSVDRAVI
ncbi:MAG: type II toxin-antitoxin system VapC family toxin [Lentisphaerae bacterium]|jgi:predicted nucleic acid-binding protein|nr:type II toxin-antitoxin system VapC family toxin [Lentisphaerota bacterium]